MKCLDDLGGLKSNLVLLSQVEQRTFPAGWFTGTCRRL